MSYTPGFGDEATWGPYSGHPNDPRAPEYEDEFEWSEDEGENEDEDGLFECRARYQR